MMNTKADLKAAIAGMIADFEKKNGKINYVAPVKVKASRKAQ